jgi:2-iminobutanoate/2-iminopropanoate deaminase
MKSAIQTPQAPAPIGPYNQAIQAGPFLFASGQIGLDPRTGSLVEGGVGEQALQVMHNIGAILAAAGLSYAHIVKTTIFLRDMADFAAVNAVYSSFFEGGYPARETVAVLGLPANALVEISVTAYVS